MHAYKHILYLLRLQRSLKKVVTMCSDPSFRSKKEAIVLNYHLWVALAHVAYMLCMYTPRYADTYIMHSEYATCAASYKRTLITRPREDYSVTFLSPPEESKQPKRHKVTSTVAVSITCLKRKASLLAPRNHVWKLILMCWYLRTLVCQSFLIRPCTYFPQLLPTKKLFTQNL